MSQVKPAWDVSHFSLQEEEEDSDSESPSDAENEEEKEGDTDTEKDSPEKNNNEGDIVKKKLGQIFDEDNTSDEEVCNAQYCLPTNSFPVHLINDEHHG